jgi:CheY-like chemotaxis protein
VNLEKVVSLALLLIYKLLMMSMLNRDDCKDISIYAMSANAFDEDVKCSLASGMNGHLSKPIDRIKLKEVLVKCLNK